MARTTLLTAGIILLLLATVPLAVAIERGLFAAMSIHGWIALGLGTVLSIVVGGGLMALVFFSARHGYDDRGDGSGD